MGSTENGGGIESEAVYKDLLPFIENQTSIASFSENFLEALKTDLKYFLALQGGAKQR